MGLRVFNIYLHRVLRTLFWSYIEERYELFSDLSYRFVLCHSVISKVLACCPPSVYLSFDGIQPSSGRKNVKDESGNNNSAIMEKVVSSDGKCNGAVSLNGTGFQCYGKCINSTVNSTPLI